MDPEALNMSFKMFDKNGDGYLDSKELSMMMPPGGEKERRRSRSGGKRRGSPGRDRKRSKSPRTEFREHDMNRDGIITRDEVHMNLGKL